MAASKHIVLVDPLGEILFSGQSVIAVDADEDAERCPETKRSAESGFFRAVDRIEQPELDDEEIIATQKRGPRAA